MPGNGDWIGLFASDFSSLDDYIVYEYVSRGKILISLRFNLITRIVIVVTANVS